jgi:FkbM family methyltransferase
VIVVIVAYARRVRALVGAYRNWPAMLWTMLLARAGLHRPELVAVTRAGTRIVCPNDGRSRSPLFEVYADDEYSLRAMRRGEGGRFVVVDVGAHVGIFALAVCERFPGAVVHCFEPSTAAFAFLSRNASGNGLNGRVRVRNAAVSDVDGSLEFFEDTAGSCRNSLYPELARDGHLPTRVTSLSFDTVVGEIGEDIDLLKLDCEGGEYPILLGAGDAALRRVRRVALEYHPATGHSLAELQGRLGAAGFRQTLHRPIRTGLGIAIFDR